MQRVVAYSCVHEKSCSDTCSTLMLCVCKMVTKVRMGSEAMNWSLLPRMFSVQNSDNRAGLPRDLPLNSLTPTPRVVFAAQGLAVPAIAGTFGLFFVDPCHCIHAIVAAGTPEMRFVCAWVHLGCSSPCSVDVARDGHCEIQTVASSWGFSRWAEATRPDLAFCLLRLDTPRRQVKKAAQQMQLRSGSLSRVLEPREALWK